MIDKFDFLKIINDFTNYHKVNENTRIQIKRWGRNHDISIFEIADILGSIPDMFNRINIAKELTLALYSPPEQFLGQLQEYAEMVYTGEV